MKNTQLTGIKYCLCATHLQGIERDSRKQSDSDLLKVQGNVWPDGARMTKPQTLISRCAGVGALPAGSGISRSSVSCLGRDYVCLSAFPLSRSIFDWYALNTYITTDIFLLETLV